MRSGRGSSLDPWNLPRDAAAPRPGSWRIRGARARRRALRSAPVRATHRHAGSGLRQAVVAHVDPSRHTRGAVRVAPWGCLGQDRDRGSPGARQSSRCLCCCPAVEAVPRAAHPQAPASLSSTSQPSQTSQSARQFRVAIAPVLNQFKVHRRRPGLRFSTRAPRTMRRWRRRSSNLRQGGQAALTKLETLAASAAVHRCVQPPEAPGEQGQGGPGGDRHGSAQPRRGRRQDSHDQARQ